MTAKRIIRGRETDLLSPLQHKSTTGDRIVLSAGKTGNVVRRASSVEIASFYSQSDPSPELHINASTEVECSSVKFARSLIGSAIDPEKALFVKGVTDFRGNL